MQLIRAFNQRTDVIDRASTAVTTPDVGFRISFKWAACTVAGGEYKYEKPNADKTAAKHANYRTAVRAEEERLGGNFSDDADFQRLVEIDRKETRRFVNEWGTKYTDANKVVFTGLSVADQSDAPIYDYLESELLEGDAALLGVFYGRLADGRTPWEHVVAYSTRGGKDDGACFFDANSGLYEFAPGEDVPDVIEEHIRNFTQDGRTIDAYNTMRLVRE